MSGGPTYFDAFLSGGLLLGRKRACTEHCVVCVLCRITLHFMSYYIRLMLVIGLWVCVGSAQCVYHVDVACFLLRLSMLVCAFMSQRACVTSYLGSCIVVPPVVVLASLV